MITHCEADFKLTIFTSNVLNSEDNNVDVEVELPNGERYVDTFFTIKNIQSLMEKYRITGECNSGQYFWASDMVLVNKLDDEVVRSVIRELLRNGELRQVFARAQ